MSPRSSSAQKRRSKVKRSATPLFDIAQGSQLHVISYPLSLEAEDRIFAAAKLPMRHSGADLRALRGTLESVVASGLIHGMKKRVDLPARKKFAKAFRDLLRAYEAVRFADERPPPEIPADWGNAVMRWSRGQQSQTTYLKAADGAIRLAPLKEGRPPDHFDGLLYPLLLDLYLVAFDVEPGITRDSDTGPAVRFLFAFHEEMARALPAVVAQIRDRAEAQLLAARWKIPKLSTLKSKVRRHVRGKPNRTIGLPPDAASKPRRVTMVPNLFAFLREQERAKSP